VRKLTFAKEPEERFADPLTASGSSRSRQFVEVLFQFCGVCFESVASGPQLASSGPQVPSFFFLLPPEPARSPFCFG